MSSRPQFTPYPVISSGSMGASIVSAVTIIQKLSMLSYSLSWTGTSPVGVISVEVSNDYSQNGDGTVNNAGTWNTLPLSDPCAVSGNTGTGFIDIDAQAGYALRLRYTRTSGTGTLSATAAGKVA
jgi:hypothetical protein